MAENNTQDSISVVGISIAFLFGAAAGAAVYHLNRGSVDKAREELAERREVQRELAAQQQQLAMGIRSQVRQRNADAKLRAAAIKARAFREAA